MLRRTGRTARDGILWPSRFRLKVAAPWSHASTAQRLKEPLYGITLPDRAVVTLLDQRYRVVYRSQTPESAIGMDLSNSEFLSALQNQNTGLVVVKSSIDGVSVSMGSGAWARPATLLWSVFRARFFMRLPGDS